MARDNQDLAMAVEVIDDELNENKKKEKRSKNFDEFGNPIPKKKRGLLKALLVIVPILLCAGFVFGLIYFNWFYARNLLIDSVNRLDPEFAQARRDFYMYSEAIDERMEEMFEFEYELFDRNEALDRREADIEFMRQGLEMKEQDLIEREERRRPIYRSDPTSIEYEEMRILGAIYSAMAPAAAAERLIELHSRANAAAILMFMSQRDASAILAEIEPADAARITEILLYN